jgi:hypothetical protein
MYIMLGFFPENFRLISQLLAVLQTQKRSSAVAKITRKPTPEMKEEMFLAQKRQFRTLERAGNILSGGKSYGELKFVVRLAIYSLSDAVIKF